MSKKAAREQRKLDKIEQSKLKSVRLQSTIIADVERIPRLEHLPDIAKQPRVGSKIFSESTPKQVKSVNTGSIFDLQMTWCARSADIVDYWSWGENRAWSQDEWNNKIIPSLNGLQGRKWQEIQQLNSGTGHRLHHSHEITDLCSEAIERWLELGHEQFDDIFRFRISSLERVWGIILQSHFFVIWYDREHNILNSYNKCNRFM